MADPIVDPQLLTGWKYVAKYEYLVENSPSCWKHVVNIEGPELLDVRVAGSTRVASAL